MRSAAAAVATALVAGLVAGLGSVGPARADEPLPAVVSGTVTSEGAPLPGAVVRLTGTSGSFQSAPADAEGRFQVEAPAGSYLACAGMLDGSVHHSCTPGNPLGTGAPTWTVAAGEARTMSFSLAPATVPLTSSPTATAARWQRKKKGYRLVYTAGPLVYRPANTVAVMDVQVDVVGSFNGATSPFTVDIQRVPGFAKPAAWGGVAPLPSVLSGPTVLEEATCGLPVDQGAGRPERIHAVPSVVQQVRSGKGAVLLTRTAAVDESACRRDRLTLAIRGAVKDKRRQIRLSARTDSAVQVYRPMARVYRSNGKLLGKRRLRVDGSIKPILLPKKFRRTALAVKVVLPATNGSPKFVEKRTVRFPRR